MAVEKFGNRFKQKVSDVKAGATKALVTIYKAQEKAKKRKSAHNAGHMLRVSAAMKQYLSEKDADDRLKELAEFTGLIHDFVRNPREISGLSDGILTGELIRYIKDKESYKPNVIAIIYVIDKSVDESLVIQEVRSLYEDMVREFPKEMKDLEESIESLSNDEISAVADAIIINEGGVASIKAWADKQEDWKRLLQYALIYGDKTIEGIGANVAVRRAQFVSGERVNNSEDLGRIFSQSDRDRIAAFAGESLLRIYAKKSVKDFPNEPIFNRAIEEGRKLEVEIYKAALAMTLKHLNLPSEKAFWLWLSEKGYPKINEEKIRKKLEERFKDDEGYTERELKTELSNDFVNDVSRFIVGLALTQNKDEKEVERGHRLLKDIHDKTLRELTQITG